LPSNGLAAALHARQKEWADAGILSVTTIGDALAPGIIAAAVFAGRRYAEELEEPRDEDAPPFKREVPELTPGPLPWSSAQ
jgi:dimethylamine/trimethylamine dehydrogenase